MATSVTIGTRVISFPDQGDSPAWGEAITDFADAVADQFQSIQSTYDISPTVSAITNSGAGTLTLSSFDSTLVRSFNFYYSIYRTSTLPTSSKPEEGIVSAVFDTRTATWNLQHEFNGPRATDGSMLNTFDMSGNNLVLSFTAYSGTGTYDTSNSKISYYAKTNQVSES